MHIRSDFCVVGGGIAGLTTARALARAGASVTVVERERAGRGAGYVAAGMLAPFIEARLGEPDVMRFGYEAVAAYPAFVAELERETGIDVDYREEGTLLVGADRDEVEQVRHVYDEQVGLGLPVEWLSGYECRRLEPFLSPNVHGGILSRHDRQVDNRLLLGALLASLRGLGVRIVEGIEGGSLVGTPPTFRSPRATITAGEFVIATGADTALLRGAVPEVARMIRPMKGQILRLDQREMRLLDHVVRTPRMYLAPKSSGDLVLGASMEEKGFDRRTTVGPIYELLRAARETLPAVLEIGITETSVGFRPATVDHMPVLGRSGREGVSLALGYYRHGVIFSPHAASILAAYLTGGRENRWLETFSAHRFHETADQR